MTAEVDSKNDQKLQRENSSGYVVRYEFGDDGKTGKAFVDGQIYFDFNQCP